MASAKPTRKTARKTGTATSRPGADATTMSPSPSPGNPADATTGTAAGGDETPRELKQRPLRDKSSPARRVLHSEPDTVTLEEVMVNFQRSLARATRASIETSRADMQIGMGQRALYVIDGIGVTLQTGVVMARDASGSIHAVSVDLGANQSGPGQAKLEFRVVARPIEPIAAQQLILADLDPLGLQRPSHKMRISLIGGRLETEAEVQAPEEPEPQQLESAEAKPAPPPPEPKRVLSPLPDRSLHLYVVGTTTGATEVFVLKTNSVGQVDVEIDALGNRLTSGERGATFKQLDLTHKDSEFFVWAACKKGMADGITADLTSSVLQYTVKRETNGDRRS